MPLRQPHKSTYQEPRNLSSTNEHQPFADASNHRHKTTERYFHRCGFFFLPPRAACQVAHLLRYLHLAPRHPSTLPTVWTHHTVTLSLLYSLYICQHFFPVDHAYSLTHLSYLLARLTCNPRHTHSTFQMAFITSFAPAFSRSALAGAKVCQSVATPARFSMAEKSPSVPFMDTPEALSPDLPGYVGFGKYSTHLPLSMPMHTYARTVTLEQSSIVVKI